MQPLIFQRSRSGRIGYRIPELDVPEVDPSSVFPEEVLRPKLPALPEVSEPEIVRHYTLLSHANHSIDLGFYPLGSCTMKYNPKFNDVVARLFADLHPLQPEDSIQGMLELMHNVIRGLCEITGMDGGTLQPYAGAHGEFAGMKIFKAYFEDLGETERSVLLVPDSAHGTNPASAHLAGFEVREIPSTPRGLVDLDAITPYLNERLAGVMLTNPNTLGLFETDVSEVADRIHRAGGLLYYDGANLNAIVGRAKPGQMGFDVVHVNLHKTFSTPHGGGGPGAGPVLVKKHLTPFLPRPGIVRRSDAFTIDDLSEKSIGRIAGFHGNIGVIVRAYAYLLSMGSDGLAAVSGLAVLNANYLKTRIAALFGKDDDGICKHEFVVSAKALKDRTGVSAKDVAKRLLDFGVHSPTVYFPINVPEAIMIEPTETETRETLDSFVEIVKQIVLEAETDPDLLLRAPHTTPIGRVDEVRAARSPVLVWFVDDSQTKV